MYATVIVAYQQVAILTVAVTSKSPTTYLLFILHPMHEISLVELLLNNPGLKN